MCSEPTPRGGYRRFGAGAARGRAPSPALSLGPSSWRGFGQQPCTDPRAARAGGETFSQLVSRGSGPWWEVSVPALSSPRPRPPAGWLHPPKPFLNAVPGGNREESAKGRVRSLARAP